jgi:hypothetical protein
VKSRLRPVVRTQVALAYEAAEMLHLVRAVNQLPPYHLCRDGGRIRIDCHSLLGGRWRCGFDFSLDERAARAAWVLQMIEHDARLTLREAFNALGSLEEIGLKQVKHGS